MSVVSSKLCRSCEILLRIQTFIYIHKHTHKIVTHDSTSLENSSSDGFTMARWLVASAHGVVSAQSFQVAALLSMVVVFLVCVTTLVGLCAAHSNPKVLNRESEPEGELVAEIKKESQRFSPSDLKSKLGSFRISSFRNPSSFSNSSSFRIDCKSQVDVVDALRKGCQAEEDPNAEPAVWQRSIMRGERCAPLSFSGLILYDEKGNPLNPEVVHNNPRSMASC